MKRRQAITLYLCHALSTWNARSYEFAAVLFTAAAFPTGLRAASFVGIANSLAAILFGSAVGRWIDGGSSRLRTLLTTIVVNKITVIAACAVWILIVHPVADPQEADEEVAQHGESILNGKAKLIAFAIVLVFGLVESLSRKANLITIERDWVPVLAPPTMIEGYTLTHVNAIMGRIDMVCKMVAPIAVSQFLALMASPKLAAVVFVGINTLSLGLEWITARRLWDSATNLREDKSKSVDSDQELPLQRPQMSDTWFPAKRTVFEAVSALRSYFDNLKLYFGTEVWAPSLAMCITHGSILSITGVTVVFFLDSGYSLQLVTIAETASAFCELSSTFITPFAVHRISQRLYASSDTSVPLSTESTHGQEPEDVADNLSDADAEPVASAAAVDAALTHTGLYGILNMFLILLPTVPALFFLTSRLTYPIPRSETKDSSPTFRTHPLVTLIILSCLAFSRLGRGIFSLTTQQLGQSRVSPQYRSSFAGVEVGLVSLFGLGHNLGTAVFSEPKRFGVLAAGSWLSLACSVGLYIWWLRRQKVEFVWWRGKNGNGGVYERVVDEG